MRDPEWDNNTVLAKITREYIHITRLAEKRSNLFPVCLDSAQDICVLLVKDAPAAF